MAAGGGSAFAETVRKMVMKKLPEWLLWGMTLGLGFLPVLLLVGLVIWGVMVWIF